MELPSKVLERQLRRAILASLHKLLPEFRAHVGRCAACDEFHDWVLWTHKRGTNEWHAECPTTGASLSMPFLFGPRDDIGELSDSK